MGEKLQGKLMFRALLGVVALAVAAGAVVMASATGETDDGSDVAAPTVLGGLKIIKSHPGLPTAVNAEIGVTLFFRFDYTCTDGTAGTVTYPTDFTGAQVQAENALPLNSVCTVTESIVGDDVADWNILSRVEGDDPQPPAFSATNPATVTIENARGNNTVHFRNEYDPVVAPPATVTIVKDFVGGSTPVTIGYVCGTTSGSVPFSVDGQVTVSVPAGSTCQFTETFDNGDAAAWSTSANGTCGLTTSATVFLTRPVTITFVNTLVDYSVTSTCPPNQ